MSYRKDFRSEEKFKIDIDKFSKLEEKLVKLFADKIGQQCYRHGFREGELEDSEVNTNADFWVDTIGLLEVKTCKTSPEFFHLKVSQIQSYIKQKAKILMVLSAEKHPAYSVIDPNSLINYDVVPFFPYGGKLCYKIPRKDFRWTGL